MYDKQCSADDGTLESPNLTENEFQYAEVLSELTQIAVFISLRSSKFRVETPDGMNKMMMAIEKDGKDYDTISPDEKIKYENQYLYENHASQRLGNQSAILQQILHNAHQDKDIKELMTKCFDDIKLNACKVTSRYIDNKKNVNLK